MRRLIVAAILAFTGACSLDSTRPDSTGLSGKYALQTINGSGLPYTFVNGADSLTITTDTIFVGTDGSWSESFAFRQTVGGQVSNGNQVDVGVLLVDGDQVEFDSTITGTVVYVGTIANSTLTLTDGNSTQIFVR